VRLFVFVCIVLGGFLAVDALSPDSLVAQPRVQAPPTFAEIQALFDRNCVRCHSGATAPRNQDLSEGNAYQNIVEVPSRELPEMNRIQAGEPHNSYLFLKISDRHLESGGRGRRMPLGRPALLPDEVRLVRRWIVAGAPP